MSSQINEMPSTDGAASVSVNIEDKISDNIEEPIKSIEGKADTRKSDMRVVININPTEIDGSEPDSAAGKGKEQADSLTESENTDSLGSGGSTDTGVVNQAYVEDETEQSNLKVGKKKGHHRSPSYSPNKDDESITAVGGGGSEELDVKDSPPILSDTTETNKEKQLYPEYFMPVNEYKPQIGEYKKSKKGPSAAKILCWMLSLLLLAGAIVLAVLIGTGIIDTDPNRTVKVSRKLEPETNELSATVDLIELKNTDLPNVRTNLPEFFTAGTTHFNGEMRLDNVEWTSDLADKNSYQFKQLAELLETGINELLRNQFESFIFDTTVTQFYQGSVIVVFNIKVNSKLETDGPLDQTDIANAIRNNIDQEHGFLFRKFSASKDSVIVQRGSQEQRKHNHDQAIEKNMQSVVWMRTTTEDTLTAKHSSQSTADTMDVKSTTISQIIDDWESIETMEISAKTNIDSSEEDEGETETETELIPQELYETGTEYTEVVTDISYQFKSLELEGELGSGDVEDATERDFTLELN